MKVDLTDFLNTNDIPISWKLLFSWPLRSE